MAKKKRLRPLNPLLRHKYLLKITAAFVIIWLATVLFFLLLAPPLSEPKIKSSDEDGANLRGQVVEAQARRRELHDVNRELKRKLESALQMQRSLIERLTRGQQHNDTASLSPLSFEDIQHLFSKDHEISKRKVVRSLWQLFHSIRHPSVNNGNGDAAIKNTENQRTCAPTSQFFLTPTGAFKIKKDANDKGDVDMRKQVLSLIAESLRLSEVDGAVEWRHQSLQRLTDSIQKKLWDSQNPENCKKRRYVICDMRHGCGFGCQVHHLAYCLLVAFASRRTLVLGDNGTHWNYHRKGWTAMFEGVSRCNVPQQNDPIKSTLPMADKNTNLERDPRQFIRLELIDFSEYRPDFLPLAIPKALSDQLILLHSNPSAFFISQFVWYVMKMKPDTENSVNSQSSQIPFDAGPIVGVHVRRKDKTFKEAKYHAVEEYMKWCDIYFQIQDRIQKRNVTRRVYIASDDPTVLPEIQKKYPNYKVYGNIKFAEAAKIRYSERSLRGVLADVLMLSKCDYLVCTFSSHVCRLAYELMQIRRGDAGDSVYSLDEVYYFGGQTPNDHIVVEGHVAANEDELDLRIGDLISLRTYHHEGYATGFSKRLGKSGRFPIFKVEEQWRIVDFPVLNE